MKAALAFLALAACYDPAAVDCTVSCAAATECARGQVCGSDGFCAAPSVAGHCGGPDGGMTSELAMLKISLEGPGKVAIEGVGTCDSDTADMCSFSVPTGTSLSLKASPKKDHEFVEWSGGCAGTSTSCVLNAVMALTQIGAKFE